MEQLSNRLRLQYAIEQGYCNYITLTTNEVLFPSSSIGSLHQSYKFNKIQLTELLDTGIETIFLVDSIDGQNKGLLVITSKEYSYLKEQKKSQVNTVLQANLSHLNTYATNSTNHISTTHNYLI